MLSAMSSFKTTTFWVKCHNQNRSSKEQLKREYQELEAKIGSDEADRIIGVDLYIKERLDGATKQYIFTEIEDLVV